MKRKFDEFTYIKSKKRISIPYDEYFGEMKLTNKQKEERIGLAESIERTFLYIFGLLAVITALDSEINSADLTSTLTARLTDDFEQNGIDLDAYPNIREYISRRAGELIDTTIRGLERDYDFTLSDDRAMLIAENESNSAFNSKDLEDAIKYGYTQKTWLTMRDRRVRHTHEVVDGETIGIYDAFEVGDALMMFPRDDSFGAGQEEIANCRCVLEYSRRRNSPQRVDNDGESDIMVSGAISGALNPESQRAAEHARRYYEAVRKMITDVARIARNTGYSEEQIQNIKNFIFLEKHDLGNEQREYFEPNYEMAESWQRLIDGKNIQSHDITLIRHEIMENELMLQGYSQDEAHIMASHEYNYREESEEYYAEINKHKSTR